MVALGATKENFDDLVPILLNFFILCQKMKVNGELKKTSLLFASKAKSILQYNNQYKGSYTDPKFYFYTRIKMLAARNFVTYFAKALMIEGKGFITLTTGACTIKHFTAVIYGFSK